MAVIAVLLGLLLPSLTSVNESARRVACRSNIRQIGLGLISFADQNGGVLPPSVYLPPQLRESSYGPRAVSWGAEPQNMLALAVPPQRKLGVTGWDGLGILYSESILPAPKIFYCPSHRGENPYQKFANMWDDNAEILGNYHYRGYGPVHNRLPNSPPSGVLTRQLDLIYPRTTALVADGMQTRLDNNHKIGVNVFRADLSAEWFSDAEGRVARSLPADRTSATSAAPVEEAWRLYDIPPDR